VPSYFLPVHKTQYCFDVPIYNVCVLSAGTETFGTLLDGEGPTPENSCASENSHLFSQNNTVLFLPKMNVDVTRPPEYIKPPEQRMISKL
jgi:hypothetical protein